MVICAYLPSCLLPVWFIVLLLLPASSSSLIAPNIAGTILVIACHLSSDSVDDYGNVGVNDEDQEEDDLD